MLGAWPPPSAALSQASPAQSLGHTMVPGDLESWLLLYLLANLSKYPKQTETITSLDLLTTLHLLQPRISLVFIAARPHCCSTFTLPCTYNSKSNHRMAGNVACTPCHCTEHYPGEWRASLVAALHPRKNWARHRTHFQNNLEDTWSKENGIE